MDKPMEVARTVVVNKIKQDNNWIVADQFLWFTRVVVLSLSLYDHSMEDCDIEEVLFLSTLS